jgi:F0F1-type ATP synthase alpha subunit
VLVLWAASEGDVDDIPLAQIAAFERALIERLERDHPSLFQEQEDLSELLDASRDALRETIQSLREN